MRIRFVEVRGLFGCYDHRVELSDDVLTFIHSLNGVGKSTTLRLMRDLFDGDSDSLSSVRFDTLTVGFDDGRVVTVDHDDTAHAVLSKDGVQNTVSIEEVDRMFDILYLSADRNMHYISKDLAVSSVKYYLSELNDMLDSKSNISVQLDMLIRCINKLYTNKTATLDNDGHLQILIDGRMPVDIDTLSSGEKQVFIMFYSIIFRAHMDSMVIIDEPEISLHVAWQQKLGRMFIEIGEMKHIQILLATHSPMIIHDRWDLARELRSEHA